MFLNKNLKYVNCLPFLSTTALSPQAAMFSLFPALSPTALPHCGVTFLKQQSKFQAFNGFFRTHQSCDPSPQALLSC